MRLFRPIGTLAVAGSAALAPFSAPPAAAQQPAGAQPLTPTPPVPRAGLTVVAEGEAGNVPVLVGRPAETPPGQPSARERDLERQALDLKRQYAAAKGADDRDKLRDRLGAVLREQFDAQQKRRKEEVDRVEERLKQLRALLQKREDAKQEIVRRRLEQLLNEADGLGWPGSEPVAPTAPAGMSPVPLPAGSGLQAK